MFAVIYRWRVAAHDAEKFRSVWQRRTERIREEAGGLGSRLHYEASEDLWYAYAQWPSREQWAAERPPLPGDAEDASRFEHLVRESMPPIELEIFDDLLLPLK